ncbi:NADPH-dependent F420 reductase [Halococcus sediminicola]|uniref:NADPH-dependent F420 reductase n=1 Tax=Halococcus sediminicola TaxID=1264579 RepID=UPI00067907BF|nr:NADPH-dependent F420 reductase [Halococcus sediminicola]
MRIALLGGTGNIGEGLALRWAQDTDHEIVIGSRNAEKGMTRARDYRNRLSEHGVEADLSGTSNTGAAAGSRVVVTSVPPAYAADTIEAVRDDLADKAIVVSPAVGMVRDETGFHYDAPEAGSIAETVAAATPDGVPVVSAFQNLAAGALTDLSNELNLDVVISGDDAEARNVLKKLAEEINGLRALDAGALANSAEIESITPLLINLAMYNDGMHDLGIQFR